MSLNKSRGNMYSFIDDTWNPVKGRCPFECSYCYVKRWGDKQKPLRLDMKELDRNLGVNNFIFVCSGCDLFHPDVPDDWIIRVLAASDQFQQNKYLLHTKNPRRVDYFSDWLNDTYTLCVTIESNIPWPGISKAPQPSERITGLRKWYGPKMVTIEPVMDFDVMTFSEMILSCEPEQVNIGADSGNNHLPEPSPEKIAALIGALRSHGIKVHLKNNLKRLYKEEAE